MKNFRSKISDNWEAQNVPKLKFSLLEICKSRIPAILEVQKFFKTQFFAALKTCQNSKYHFWKFLWLNSSTLLRNDLFTFFQTIWRKKSNFNFCKITLTLKTLWFHEIFLLCFHSFCSFQFHTQELVLISRKKEFLIFFLVWALAKLWLDWVLGFGPHSINTRLSAKARHLYMDYWLNLKIGSVGISGAKIWICQKVWNVMNFLSLWSLILREINFSEFRSSKSAIFAILGVLNFVDLQNFSLQKVQKC